MRKTLPLMDAFGRPRRGLAAALLLLACAEERPLVARTRVPEVESVEAPAEPTSSPAPARIIRAGEVGLPLPDGYEDVSAELATNGLVLVFLAKERRSGYQPSIAIRKVSIPGGSFADPLTCLETGRGLILGGSEAPGPGGTLKSAELIDGPLGKTCQIHLVAEEGATLITELHRPGNTPQTPQELWLMTCNHAGGDTAAEATCRSALAGFRLLR